MPEHRDPKSHRVPWDPSMFHSTVQFSRLSEELLWQILSSIAFAEQDPYLIRATNRIIKMAYDDGRGVWHLICQGKGLLGLNPNQARQRCDEYLRAPLLEALETLKPGCVGTGSNFMQQGQMYQHLDLSFGNMSSLPASIGGCTALQKLYLSNCSSLTSLGDGVGGLKSLELLDCRKCYSLSSLGDGIGGCTALKTLKLQYCSSLTSLGDGFKKLRLTKLVLGRTPLDGAEETYAVLSQISTLTELDLSGSKITALAQGIGGCTALKKLILYKCTSLTSLGDAIGGLTSLTYLNVSYTAIKELSEGIGGCTALEDLVLSGCSSLISLGDGIGGCTALQELFLYDCSSLTSLGDGVKQLESQGCQIYG